MSEADKAAEAHVKKLIEDYPEIYPTDLDRAKSHFLAGYAAAQQWMPIESAPKDGRVIIVNDNSTSYPQFVAAKYLNGDEWQGWIYDDELLLDANPEGPQPTLWFDLPPLPKPPEAG